MRTTSKYYYTAVIQQNYGCGFEDVSEYNTDSQGNPVEFVNTVVPEGSSPKKISLLRNDLIEYKLTGYPTRVVNRRTLK